MLAIGAGGLEVALAMAGEPFHLRVPKILGVTLDGALPDWVSAKDVILEMLRRHGVTGGLGKIIEYRGPGLACLRRWIATSSRTWAPSSARRRRCFPPTAKCGASCGRRAASATTPSWSRTRARPTTSRMRSISSALEPLIALPSSPGNVVPVREVAGREIYQAYVGSSANPGFRDFAIAAEIVKGKHVSDRVSFDINPTSRQILENLVADGHVNTLLHAGARLHQAGCNGCIGMGQAPATDRISLRTVPRNFPGRSGTREDQVYLVSPETAAASALTGTITDPRTLDMAYPKVRDPDHVQLDREMLVSPLSVERALPIALEKGPNIQALPVLDSLPDELDAPVLLKLGDDVSTDEILPAGARVLPYRSNIEHISEFAFEPIDSSYPGRALEAHRTGHVIVAGKNYGQGSSREHAALAPRYLGLRIVIARQFARIHQGNLVNFGVLPLVFHDPADYDKIEQDDFIVVHGLRQALRDGNSLELEDRTRGFRFRADHQLSPRQRDMVLAGGLIPLMRHRFEHAA